MQEIEAQRREIEELLEGGERLVSDLEGAGRKLGKRVGEMGESAREAERGLESVS